MLPSKGLLLAIVVFFCFYLTFYYWNMFLLHRQELDASPILSKPDMQAKMGNILEVVQVPLTQATPSLPQTTPSLPQTTPSLPQTTPPSLVQPTDDTNLKYLKLACAKGGGLNDCRMVVIEAIFLASILNRIVVLPLYRENFNTEPTIQFSSLFDVGYLNAYLGSMAHVIESHELPVDVATLIAPAIPFDPPMGEFPVDGIINETTKFKENKIIDYGQYHSHYRLQAAARMIVGEIQKEGDTFACLHLRIEQDWKNLYTKDLFEVGAIIDKITNHPIAKEIDTLYIAGGNLGNNLPTLQQTFKKVVTKSNFSDPLITKATSEVDTTKALIDFEICRQADIFIGNNGSYFSRNIDNWMKYNGKPSLAYNIVNTYAVVPFCNVKLHPVYYRKHCT